jgi:hypothetical protein
MWILAAAIPLACFALSRKLELVPQRLLRALIAYYTVSYLGRGLYLLLVNPTPGFGTTIADVRLLVPNYQSGLDDLATLALPGLVVLLGSYYGASRILSRIAPLRLDHAERVTSWFAAAMMVLMLGWLVRVYLLATADVGATGLLGRMATVPLAAVGLIIVCTDWRKAGYLRLIVLVALLGEALWGFKVASKDPVLAAALFLYIDPRRRPISWPVTAAAVAAVAAAFVIIEPAKVTLAPADYAYNTALFVPATIVARFDLLHSLTDAFVLPPGTYMQVPEFFSRIFGAWVPSTLGVADKVPSGVLWGIRMAGATSGVSLADGPTAEGYGIAGMAGVVLWNVVIGTAAALTAAILRRSAFLPLSIAAIYVLSSNSLFERGILGLNEAISDGFQVALVSLIPYLLSWQVHRRPMASAQRAFAAGQGLQRPGAATLLPKHPHARS